MGALGAAQPQKSMGEDAALQKLVELVLDESGQRGAGLRLDLREEGLEVFLDQLVSRRLFGAAALVVDSVRGRLVLMPRVHDPGHPTYRWPKY